LAVGSVFAAKSHFSLCKTVPHYLIPRKKRRLAGFGVWLGSALAISARAGHDDAAAVR
jgi:hypothetical protein